MAPADWLAGWVSIASQTPPDWRPVVVMGPAAIGMSMMQSDVERLLTSAPGGSGFQEDITMKEPLGIVAGSAPPDHIEQFFAWAHLPPHLQEVSKPFGQLADQIVANVPRNPERTVALRKLLEAKDAAVRAVVAK